MPMYRHAATTTAERELTQAVRRVVERYGNDLTVYFRQVEERAKKKALQTGSQESTEDKSDESGSES